MNNPRNFGVPKERKTERSNEKRVATNIQPKKSVYLTDGSHYFVAQIWSTRFQQIFPSSNCGRFFSDFVGDMMMPKNKAND